MMYKYSDVLAVFMLGFFAASVIFIVVINKILSICQI